MGWKNREKMLEYYHEYYQKHKGKMNLQTKEYGQKHREQRHQTHKRYYEKNRLKILQQAKEYREKHREEQREYQRLYRLTYHEKFLKCLHYTQARRLEEARKIQIDILREHGFKCDRCGFDDARALEIHHVNGNNFKRKDTNRWYKTALELKNRTVTIEVLCANCHKILHNTRKIDAEGRDISLIVDLQSRAFQGIAEIQAKVKI